MLGYSVEFHRVFHIQNIGYMLSNILPFRIGDVARAVLIGKTPPVTVARGVSTMITERVLDMLFVVTLLPFSLAGIDRLPNWLRAAANASGFMVIVTLLLLIGVANSRTLSMRVSAAFFNRFSALESSKWFGQLEGLLDGLTSLTSVSNGLILMLYSIAVWLPIIFAYYMALIAVNLDPTWSVAAFVVCAAAFSVAAPSSPGQVGVFHAGVIAALRLLGQPEAESASFAFLYHALNVALMVILGRIGLARTGITLRQVVVAAQQHLTRERSQQEE
jgi:uncharacterized protein (TIRG00374 family)